MEAVRLETAQDNMKISKITFLVFTVQCLCVAACLAIAVTAHAKAWQWIDASRVRTMVKEGSALWLIDVRSKTAYETGHIEGSVNIPSSALAYKQFPRRRTLVLVDDSLGLRTAREAAGILAKNGRNPVYVLSGGIVAWKQEGHPIVEHGPAVRSVTPAELKLAIAQEIPLTLYDMRDEKDRKQGVLSNSEPVPGKTMDKRVAKLRKLLKKRTRKGLMGRIKKSQPVVLVFSASEDSEVRVRQVLKGTAGDVRYLIGGYEALISRDLRASRVSGACATCPGGAR